MEPNELFRNEGDGTFTEVAHRTGVENWGGNGMGLLFMDVNRDGWPDIFIANDNTPNTLLLNHGGKRFEDVSAAAGVDDARGSMGCTAGDYDNDGDLEIFYGNSYTQGIALLKSRLDRKHPFRIAYSDIVARARIADVSREYTQWGCVFLDYDNDGFLDLFFVNGGLTLLHDWETLTPEPYYLLHNEGDGTFADVTAGCGEALQGLHQGKGVAVLDYDGDGNCDLVINHLAAPAALLRNEGGHGNNWLELSLVGTACNRNAVGARITVAAGDLVQCRVVSCGDSYLGCSSRTSHFGLGKHGKADLVEIAWPDGKVQRLRDVQPNRLVTVRQP